MTLCSPPLALPGPWLRRRVDGGFFHMEASRADDQDDSDSDLDAVWGPDTPWALLSRRTSSHKLGPPFDLRALSDSGAFVGESRAELTASVVGNVRVVDRVETAWPWGSFHLTFVGALRRAVGVRVGDGVRGPAAMTPPQLPLLLGALLPGGGEGTWDDTGSQKKGVGRDGPPMPAVSRRSVRIPMEIWRSILFHFQSGHGFNHSRLHGLEECADG